jgi:hypothetical protein
LAVMYRASGRLLSTVETVLAEHPHFLASSRMVTMSTDSSLLLVS